MTTIIYTIGHGNRAIEEFIALLVDARIECLVDVRAFPASRRHPQFGREALEHSLADAGLRYIWEGKALGGRRKPVKNSPHTAIRNESFRAYADHMVSGEFRQALDRLIAFGAIQRTAIMCAERLPWECHRYLISDSLAARDVSVAHLIAPGKGHTHELNKSARLDRGDLVYDVEIQREHDA